jgi:proline dehydrogenase
MLQALSKATFSVLAGSNLLKKAASRYGMRRPQSFARRFVAGETMQELVHAVRALEAQGLTTTLDHLGERVTDRQAAQAAAQEYGEIIRMAAEAGISRNLSVKLTQIGLDIDRATCIDNLRRVLEAAREVDGFVRIDMEDSSYTDDTLDTFETLWKIGYTNVGVVIQSCLRRSPEDVKRVNRLGARVRLVKGAYSEPRDVAYHRKQDVDEAFLALMEVLLTEGTYPAIATHDPALIDATRAFVAANNVPKTAFEFQMLFGLRRDLRRQLLADGYPVRIYVPFGREWFPYFMRRLGERPANVGFVMRSLVREEVDAGTRPPLENAAGQPSDS